MPSDPDIIILGAGAAGLAAATDLTHAGLRVLILEARDRLGGRMHTLTDPALNFPIELGAEFIHGRPPEIWDILQHPGIQPTEVAGDNWCFLQGQLRPCDFFSQVDDLLGKMNDTAPDQSFLHFLEQCCPDPSQQDSKRWARRYVTGFHAADPALISVHSLLKGMRAEEKIDGERAFRLPLGYQFLVDHFHRQLAGVPIRLNTVVEAVDWSPARVRIKARTSTQSLDITAPRLLVTLPLGVLQARLDQPGAVRFNPALPSRKIAALEKLSMGHVIRLSLRFRERFWDHIQPPNSDPSRTLSDMRFLFSQDDPFPTWWTTMPVKLPLLTAWAPFHCADQLSGKPDAFVRNSALKYLSAVFKLSENSLDDLLDQVYFHDWQNDPFSRGAYSYVKVGGDHAQADLGSPLEDTLFFAGEATDVSGHNGTVHGAIASGRRAAAEILHA